MLYRKEGKRYKKTGWDKIPHSEGVYVVHSLGTGGKTTHYRPSKELDLPELEIIAEDCMFAEVLVNNLVKVFEEWEKKPMSKMDIARKAVEYTRQEILGSKPGRGKRQRKLRQKKRLKRKEIL